MNFVYVYDGNFISLLHLIYYLVKQQITPYKIKNTMYSASLFEEEIFLPQNHNEQIISSIISGMGLFAFRVMQDVFLSDEEEKELLLYYFFRNGVKYRKNICYQRNLKCVYRSLKISQYVSHELHKMKGFLRFRELENHVLFAEMEPNNQILFPLSLHFQKRLKQEFWIIHDRRHHLISLYDKKQFIIVSDNDFTLPSKKESEEEKNMVQLWKLFYQTIGITERKNERCRRNFMPKKYWKYITEVKEEL